jgi:hypothetical protein
VIGDGAQTIAVPASTASPASTPAFTAVVKDQFDAEIPEETVTWSIPTTAGVSIAPTGVLSVTNDAAAGDVTITATDGTVTATKVVKITKAASVAATVTLTPATMPLVPVDIPTTGSTVVDNVLTVTANDQYGKAMASPAVTWVVLPANAGVSVNQDNKLVVDASAKNTVPTAAPVPYTIIAMVGGASSVPIMLSIKRAAPIASSIKVFKDGTAITGTTDIITIPTTNTPNTRTYTAVVYDQYDTEMPDAAATLVFATADDNVTYSNGTVSVAKTAVKDTPYTLTASYGILADKVITITVKDIAITPPTVTPAIAAPVYGDTWAQIIPATAITGGKAELNGTEIKGTFYLKSTGTPNAGTQTYTVNFKSDNNAYDVQALTGTVTVAKRPVTVTAKNVSLVYGSDVPAAYEAVVTSKLSPALVGEDTLAYTVACSYEATSAVSTSPLPITVTSGTNDNYAVTAVNGNLTITPRSITGAAVVLATPALIYNGGVQMQAVTSVTLNGTPLAPSDYTVANNQETNHGSYSLTVTGTGNYKDSVQVPFSIAQRSVSPSASITGTFTYKGSAYTPEPTVTGAALTKGTDYTVSYSDNISAGTAKCRISPVSSSNYTFTAFDQNFTIAPATLTAKYNGETVYVGGTINPHNVTVIGFVNGETAATAAGYIAPSVSHATNTAGTFDVAPAGGAADNYTFSYVPGTLKVVNHLDATIKAAAPAVDTTNGGKYSAKLTPSGVNTADVAVAASSNLAAGTRDGVNGTWIGLTLDSLKLNGTDATGVKYSTDGTTWKNLGSDKTVFANVAGTAPKIYLKDSTGTVLTLNIHYMPASGPVAGYSVSVGTYDGGVVTSDKSTARSGDKVTLRPSADNGRTLTSLTVTDTAGNEIDLTKNADGTYTFTMPARSVNVSAVFQGDWANPYADVRGSDWFYDDVRYVTENGLMNGSGSYFMPLNLTTRAQVVTILWRMAGSPRTASDAGFTDLTQAWYKTAVNWAAANGIATGIGGSRFDPDGSVTREQFAAFLYRYAQFLGKDVSASASLADFTDSASVSPWALKAVKWAVAEHIISGSDSRLMPASGATRAELAAMFARFSKLVG